MRISVHTAAAIAIAAATNLAAADVTLNADSEYGTATITVDNTNNLEFLDLPLTTGISYDDMVGTHLAAGGIYEGWRHATNDDILALLDSAGVSMINFSRLAPVDLAVNLAQSFGLTDSFPDGNLASGIYDLNGNSRIFRFGPAYDFDKFEDVAYFNYSSIDEDEASEFAGHYLVRPVPAPGSAALLTLGTLAATRRRR